VVAKTLKSAIANAEHNNNASPESLVVKMAVAGQGPVMKRFIPKARGSAGPILKRTCHVKIVVSDLS
jgi:large subunit ribosomal protein L22